MSVHAIHGKKNHESLLVYSLWFGSVLTEVGVISKSYLSALLLGREDSKQQRETKTYSQMKREMEIPIIILEVIIIKLSLQFASKQ